MTKDDERSTSNHASSETLGMAAGAEALAQQLITQSQHDNTPEQGWGGRVWHLLIGQPLRSKEASKEQIGRVEGLAALSLDALTSVAYGPEAMMAVLIAGGASALHLVVPITAVIVALLVLLVLSYRQVIEAYPMGGGAYTVSRENLGQSVSQLAAAALVVDYTLTVAVSIAAGVAVFVSAFPALVPYQLFLCLAILAVITWLNLRGLGDSARAFLLPTLVFIIGLLSVIAIGLIHPLAPHIHLQNQPVKPAFPLEAIGILLLLKAFSAGCSALTGVEAIANGVPLFKKPRVKRAKSTELALGVILGVMLLGLAILAVHFQVRPRVNMAVLNQIMIYSVGHGAFYYIMSITITLVLALAANTSFGSMPVLASLLARDGYLPRAFTIRGDRLVFNSGIWSLAVLSGALLIAVNGNTNALIPMFAIGVFTGFTLAQSGMVVHWKRTGGNGWQGRAFLNGLGAVMTAAATVIFLVTKFTSGAFVVVIAVPGLIVLFHAVSRYYSQLGQVLRIGEIPDVKPQRRRTLVIVPVNGISRLTEMALSDACSLGEDVLAVSVRFDDDQEAAAELQHRWEEWQPGVELVILRSDYHSVVRPLIRFVNSLDRKSHELVAVLIPVVIPRKRRHVLLHNQMDRVLGAAFRHRSDVVVGRIPLRLEE
ncbi:MAG: APC family permease [Actinobacteria bacterium]|nr:APC family permease [Actinomycetota bacterium]MCL6094327.1 APC family permease [Actinomycetota bacterium]